MTSASPSTRRIAWKSEGTRLIYSRECTKLHTPALAAAGTTQRQCRLQHVRSLILEGAWPGACRKRGTAPFCDGSGAARRAELVDANHLHELVATSLIRRHDALGPQVLQHALVAVVRRPDAVHAGQCRLEAGKRHGLLSYRAVS